MAGLRLTRRTQTLGYRLGLRRRLDKADLVTGLVIVLGSSLIVFYYIVSAAAPAPSRPWAAVHDRLLRSAGARTGG